MIEPKIRFNKNSWQKHKVGDLCDLLTGYPFPGDKILNKGSNLLMRGINITEGRIRHSQDIDRYYNEDTISLEKYRLQVGDLVIGMDGSKVGKNSALVTSKENNSLLVQRVARLRNKDKNLISLIQIAVSSGKFIKYVEEMKTSSAIPHISPADIRNFPLSLPEDSEERKLIASYFTSLDSQITAATSRLASLKQMKAASLQAMFPQEGESVPKVRFKGFEEEWSTCPLNSFAQKRIEKNTKMLYNITLTNSAEFGIIDQKKFFDHDVSNSENINGYYIVKEHDFVYNPRISSTAPVGPINQNKLGYTGVMSPLYFVFEIRGINRDFLEIFFHTTLWHKYMFDHGNTGARFDRLAINEEDFMNMPIPNINIKEQQAIANYFTSLDRQITLQTQRLEKLKQIKAACLDKMFV